jgi:hypothetical protein
MCAPQWPSIASFGKAVARCQLPVASLFERQHAIHDRQFSEDIACRSGIEYFVILITDKIGYQYDQRMGFLIILY